MPQIKSKQILGELPVKPDDIATKGYVDSLVASGSGSSTLIVQDDNTQVLSGVTILNFIGANVLALANGSSQVNIWIPPPVYAPLFNSTGAPVNNSTPRTNRYIALPTSEGTPYKIGNWESTPSTPRSTVRNSVTSMSYVTPNAFNLYNSATTLQAEIIDADDVTIIDQFTVAFLSAGTYISPSTNLTIQILSILPDADKFKATVDVTFNIANYLPNGGRFSIKITHFDGTEYVGI